MPAGMVCGTPRPTQPVGVLRFLSWLPLALLPATGWSAPDNLMQGAKVSASSSRANHPAEKVVDGVVDDPSRWLAAESDPSPWLEIVFPHLVTWLPNRVYGGE